MRYRFAGNLRVGNGGSVMGCNGNGAIEHDASFQRAQLVFHETAHQWIGNLVTMRSFDDLWIKGFAGGSVKLGRWSWKKGDAGLIDGVLVDGSAMLVDRVAGVVRRIQNGRLYNYAFAMILGLIVLLAVLVRITAGA